LSSGGAVEGIRIDSSGNVGIGTSSPSDILTLAGGASGSYGVTINNAKEGGGTKALFQYDRDNGIAVLGGNTTNGLNFKTLTGGSLTEKMRITSAGNVGIGNSNPGALLTVTGSGNIARFGDGTNTFNIRFVGPNNWMQQLNTSTDVFSIQRNSSDLLAINSSGIVTMSAYGAGAATFSASGVISSVSDETWKIKDGVPTNPDAMLQKLEAGYWFYNDEKAPIFGKERQLGFYAQNVHEAIGEEAAPTPKEGKPWGYYDRSVLAVAVMSLKNALSTIEELKQRIEILENK
jgi:hypothetical protein